MVQQPVRPITSVLDFRQDVKIRVYIVAANGLSAKDGTLNIDLPGSPISLGSSDPYIVLQMEVPPEVKGASPDTPKHFTGVSMPAIPIAI